MTVLHILLTWSGPKKRSAFNKGREMNKPLFKPETASRCYIEARKPPRYEGLRRYRLSDEERAEFGITSVDELVTIINNHLIAAGKWPLSQGDFPSRKESFRKVADLARAYRGSEKP